MYSDCTYNAARAVSGWCGAVSGWSVSRDGQLRSRRSQRVALFVYGVIALTQLRLRQKMTPDEEGGLGVKVRFFPWPNIFLIAGVLVVVVIMLTTDTGRTQVWTSLVATGVLVLFWPVVRRKLRRMRAEDEEPEKVLARE